MMYRLYSPRLAVIGGGLASVLLLVATVPAHAVKESRLWLPKKYKHYMPRLVNAAEMAEQAEHCTEVVDGQIDLKRTEDDKPVFRIVCRDTAGSTYSLLTNPEVEADGDNDLFDRADLLRPRGYRDRVKPIDAARGWKVCEAAMRTRMLKMVSPTFLEEQNQVPEVTELGASFYDMEVDALTPGGDLLQYTARCKVLPSGVFTIKLGARDKMLPAMNKGGQATEMMDKSGMAKELEGQVDGLTDGAMSGSMMDGSATDSAAADKSMKKSSAPRVDDDGWQTGTANSVSNQSDQAVDGWESDSDDAGFESVESRTQRNDANGTAVSPDRSNGATTSDDGWIAE